MKILILGSNQIRRYNWGHELFKLEIARQHDARFYGDTYAHWAKDKLSIQDIIELLDFEPDLIFTYMGKYCKWVKGLDKVRIPKVHNVIDYFSWNYVQHMTSILTEILCTESLD